MTTTSTKWRDGWKVMKYDQDNGFVSCSSFDTVSYDYDKITRPKNNCGPLTVFKNWNEAINFVLIFSDIPKPYIAPCHYKPSKTKDKVWCLGVERLFEHLPEGSILADAVKITGTPLPVKTD